MSHYDTEITTTWLSLGNAVTETAGVRVADDNVTVVFDADLVRDQPVVTAGFQIDDPISLLRLAESCLAAAAHRLSSDNRLNLHGLSTIDAGALDAERHRLRTTAARIELVGSEWARIARLATEIKAEGQS